MSQLSRLNPGESSAFGPDTARQRRNQAFEIRQEAALFEKYQVLPWFPCNDDELLYPAKIGNYSKALPHNELGDVDPPAYQLMLEALITGNREILDAIPLGGAVKLTNPQAAYAYELIGPDSHHVGLAPPPAFSSPENAGEMEELYWMALCRDVPFSEYETNTLTKKAALELTRFPHFRGPRIKGTITAQTLFRFDVPGALEGPYVSQFLFRDIPFGAARITQQYRTAMPNKDFLTSYQEWLNIQNGHLPAQQLEFDSLPRYIRNPPASGLPGRSPHTPGISFPVTRSQQEPASPSIKFSEGETKEVFMIGVPVVLEDTDRNFFTELDAFRTIGTPVDTGKITAHGDIGGKFIQFPAYC